MFVKYDDNSVRLTGRWNKTPDAAIATAAGSAIEFAYHGGMAVLHFDMTWSENPYPHLWISVDGGAKIEAPMDSYLRIQAKDAGEHIVRVIYKSAVEQQHRWYAPLIGKIAFLGFEADGAGVLPEDNRKTIEFVGDSITEGVLIDESYKPHTLDQLNRPCQDDVTATYAYLTAEKLNLRPVFMGYGAVGATKSGCGSVPKAALAYPFCYDGAPITRPEPDYILINHGANDGGASADSYIAGYAELLDCVIRLNPNAKIIVLSAFCGAHASALGNFVAQYGEKAGRDILFIDSTGWVPLEPLHPLRDGHAVIAEHLSAVLQNKCGEGS